MCNFEAVVRRANAWLLVSCLCRFGNRCLIVLFSFINVVVLIAVDTLVCSAAEPNDSNLLDHHLVLSGHLNR
jgi:hypothetical protein